MSDELIKLVAEELEGLENCTAVVRKSGDQWCVFSKEGKKLGCYSSRKEAVDRLRQIEYFKKQNAIQGVFAVKAANDPRNDEIKSTAPSDKATANDLLNKNIVGEVNI